MELIYQCLETGFYGKWYYLNEDGWMLKDTNTPDGYHVDANGVWDGDAVTEETAEII